MTTRTYRKAFTLFEIIVAMALTGVVMVLVAGAVDFHLRQLTVRRTRIEEAQLARAVLRRIADDLRAIVILPPADSESGQLSSTSSASASGGSTSGSSTSAGSTSSGSTSGGSTSGGTQTGQTGTSGESSQSTSSSAEDIASSSAPPSTPGLFGNQNQLLVDISRIPRYEEYQLMASYGDPSQLGSLSDVKNVAYFVVGASGATGASSLSVSTIGTSQPDGSVSGLVRRVVNRATARWAQENGSYNSRDQNAELIAPEIAAIQFAYFDGIQWTSEWDSELLGGIPMAVEIMISVQSESSTFASISDLQNAMASGGGVYRMVVRLPGAEIIEATTTDASSTQTTSGT